MGRKTSSSIAADAILAAVKSRDDEALFTVLKSVAVEARNIALHDLDERLRMLCVLSNLHESIAFHQFKVRTGTVEGGEEVIAWADAGAALFAAEVASFGRQLGAERFARYVERLIALYPGGKLPSSLDKLRRVAERVELSAIERAHKDSEAAVADLASALRPWLRTNAREIVNEIGSVGHTTKRVRGFAREIASAFGGKLRANESTWDEVTLSQFLVTGTRRSWALSFQVFDGGCIVSGETTRKPAVGIAFNCAIDRIDRRVRGVASEPMPAFRYRFYKGGQELDPPLADALREQLTDLWADEHVRSTLIALRLAPNEPLLFLERPMYSGGRPTVYLVHRSTDVAELMRRLDLLAEVFPPVGDKAAVAKPISDRVHRIKIGRTRPAASARHYFGGALEDAPTCANCRAPVHAILTIDTTDPALGLPSLGRPSLPIVYCLNCMSWRPLYVDYSAPALRIVTQHKEQRANDDPPLDRRSVSFTALSAPKAPGSKLGGAPKWLQGPEIPDCAACAKPMSFLAQIRSLPDMAFGDDGTLYAFVCVGCRLAATFIQSH